LRQPGAPVEVGYQAEAGIVEIKLEIRLVHASSKMRAIGTMLMIKKEIKKQ
jgi:hypothetical protein